MKGGREGWLLKLRSYVLDSVDLWRYTVHGVSTILHQFDVPGTPVVPISHMYIAGSFSHIDHQSCTSLSCDHIV